MRTSSLLILIGVLAAPIAARPANDRPNVLMITVDDLNDWVGFLGGHPQARTPHLDRLAERSRLFTNAHCAAPACLPSRVAIHFGISPHRSGVYHNTNLHYREFPALVRATSMERWFREQGYVTLATGKIYHLFGTRLFQNPSRADEWDVSWPSADQREPRVTYDKERPPAIGWTRVAAPPAGELRDMQKARWAVSQLAAARERPFFLSVGLGQAHLPWFAHEEHLRRLPPAEKIETAPTRTGDLEDVPPVARERMGGFRKRFSPEEAREMTRAYLATIASVDDAVGVLMAGLAASPHKDNTILVLLSDHGLHCGEKERWGKMTLWEEATRVPFMIAAPGVAPGRTGAPVSLLDLYPTLVRLCGQGASLEGLDGNDLSPLLADPTADWPHVALTFMGRNVSVRDARWRYTRYLDGSEELYDHEADPHEWHNLAAQDPLAELKERLRGHCPTQFAESARPTQRK